MVFERLVELVQDEPAFETGFLLAGDVDPHHIRRQLTRWVKAGKIYQLRRGLYALAPPFQKKKPPPFVLANLLVPGSYVSCQSALAHYGLIPEYVPAVVSACSSRPRQWDTPLGSFIFRHVHPRYLFGYRQIEVGGDQQALIATPEKALLDLVYLTPGGDTEDYLQSLRLQNLEQLDLDALGEAALGFAKPKLARSTAVIEGVVRAWLEEGRR